MKKQFLLGLMAMVLPLTTWAADTPISVSFLNKVDYAGKNTEQNVKIALTVGDKTLVPGSNYDLKVTKFNETPVSDGKKIHDAGTYEVTITLNGSYASGYELKGAAGNTVTNGNTIKFEVAQKTLDSEYISLKNEVSKEYGYKVDVKDLVDVKTGALAENDDSAVELEDLLKCLEVVRPGVEASQPIKDVYNYTINLRAATNSGSNYKYIESEPLDQGLLKIIPKRLKATLSGEYKGEAVANLNDISKTDCAEYKNNKYTDVLDDDQANFDIKFTIPTGTTIKNWNSTGYTVTATPTLDGVETKNYEVTATYKIEKVLLTIAPATTLGVSFPTEIPAELNDYFDFRGLKGDDAKAKTNSNATTNSQFAKENLGLTMKIVDPMTFGETKDIYPFVGTTKVETAKQANDPHKGKYINTTALDNYVIEYEVQKFSAWKKQLDGTYFEYTWNDEADLTYQGQEFEVPGNIVKIVFKKDGKEYPLEYDVDYTLVAVNSAGSVRDAGDKFRVKVIAKASSEKVQGDYETPVGGKVFEVVKAPLTIKRTDKELVKVKGSDDLDLYDGYFDFVEGFVGEDKTAYDEGNLKDLVSIFRTGTITSEEVTEGETAPYYIRIWTNRLQAKNYDFGRKTYGNGDGEYADLGRLTILSPNLVLDGAVEDDQIVKDLEVYNGLTVKNVIVKNLKSILDGGIKGGQWYTLVLPFEVTVRELSKAFGYAIVNVPNDANESADSIKFKLTMGTVEANTLMAFKVDQDLDWDEIIGYNENKGEIVFKEKKIVAPTGKWATDAAGNEFIGVYETTKTEKGVDYWMWTDGQFWNGAIEINPLSGYIHSGSGNQNARIYFEEADGTTTAVDVVKMNGANKADAEGWYSIGGMKLNAQPTQKGVYINNGKKVVIK